MSKAWRKEHGKGKTVGVAVMGLRVNFIFVLSVVVFDVFFKFLIEYQVLRNLDHTHGEFFVMGA